MYVYLIVILFSGILAQLFLTRQQKMEGGSFPRRLAISPVLVFLTLGVVAALRWRVGTDYWTYERLFPRYVEELADSFHIFGEPGMRLIAWIAMQTTGDSAAMFAIASVLTIGLFVMTIWRWSPLFSYSIVILIVSGAWYGSFNGVRQYIACAILFAGHRYIIDRKAAKWILVVLIAMLFHVSAFVGLLYYLVPVRKTNFRIQIVLLGVGIIGMLGLGSLIEYLEGIDPDRWGGEYANHSLNPLRVAFSFVPIALYWFLNVRNKIKSENAEFYVNMLLIYALTYLVSATSAMAARFAIYPLPYLTIGLVYVTSVGDRREKVLIRLLVAVIYGFFMYVEISNTANLANFRWIFERNEAGV